MPESIQTARELATHAADIAHLQSDMDKLVESVAIMQKTLMDIDRTLSEAKGGWKMLLAVGGAGGAVGAFLVQIAHWWGK
jgi:NADPH:quinone reductase-like Zn-dependent oxidoreductase